MISIPAPPARNRYQTGHYLGSLLEMACQELELPVSARDRAVQAYGAVGKHLDADPNLQHFKPLIYSQGSIALGTTVKPLSGDEFDVDLVCQLVHGDRSLSQRSVKDAIGNRLREDANYQRMLEEFRRCWRLNYAEGARMHLDITPAVSDVTLGGTRILVTDRESKRWEPSNPKGFVEWFNGFAKKTPRIKTVGYILNREMYKEAAVEKLPEYPMMKDFLRRTVQLLKRHRSLYFEKRPEEAPISIILTALAAKAYGEVSQELFDTEFDVIVAIIARMPRHIGRPSTHGRWYIPNESNTNENFADKWNNDEKRPAAFNEWHARALQDFNAIANAPDNKTALRLLGGVTGGKVTGVIQNRITETTNTARGNRALFISATGLVGTSSGISVRPNTFFGL
jgi:hypothetical protein